MFDHSPECNFANSTNYRDPGGHICVFLPVAGLVRTSVSQGCAPMIRTRSGFMACSCAPQ
jgi:hypothetical protein